MPDDKVSHEVYTNKSEIPFIHLENLGCGRFGVVDKVERACSGDNEVYARKTIRTDYYNSQKQIEKIMAEIKIVRKLQHPHIVNVVATYQANREFGIIMQPVADMDLGEYLAETDSLLEDAMSNLEWLTRCNRLKRWMRCLVQAMEYIHGERIRHKDLKPANILVRSENIYITDFGVSKDLIDEATTASLGTQGERGTPMYCAPELYSEGQRRGRATDMFSLGCIFLEMTTIFAGVGTLRKFTDFRLTNGSRAYASNDEKTCRWVCHLRSQSTSSLTHETNLVAIAALLDPEPDGRPTASDLSRHDQVWLGKTCCWRTNTNWVPGLDSDIRGFPPSFKSFQVSLIEDPLNLSYPLPFPLERDAWLIRPYLEKPSPKSGTKIVTRYDPVDREREHGGGLERFLHPETHILLQNISSQF